MSTVYLKFPIKPKPVQSTRFSNKHCYTDKDVIAFKNTIKAMAIQQLKEQNFNTVMTNAVRVDKLIYTFKRPKYHYNSKGILKPNMPYYKITRPDITDNLNKGVFDSLNRLVYKDDSQVCLYEGVKKKIFGDDYCIEIVLTEISDITGKEL